MFARNEWTVSEDGWFKGPGHCSFNVKTSTPAAISRAVVQSWGEAVQQACNHRTGLHRMPVPQRDSTIRVLRCFKPCEQLMLARHVSGGFMSQAEKHSWNAEVSAECPLCGETDTKYHRLYECMPLATAREPYHDLLQAVKRHRPWWPHMFMASEHADAAMFRLISNSRRLPPVVDLPSPGFVQLFTGGAARHSSTPEARLTYWGVVQACGPGQPVNPAAWVQFSAQAQQASFKVVCMGSTPGDQTAPRAELAALAWSATWLGNKPGYQVEVHTDCQFVVDTWQRLQRGDSLSTLSPSRLGASFIGGP